MGKTQLTEYFDHHQFQFTFNTSNKHLRLINKLIYIFKKIVYKKPFRQDMIKQNYLAFDTKNIKYNNKK
jgi:hypothetical protein